MKQETMYFAINVDSLCIVQDEDFVKFFWTHRMHEIYEDALITIVAASGEHDDSGLSGMVWSLEAGIGTRSVQVVNVPSFIDSLKFSMGSVRNSP